MLLFIIYQPICFYLFFWFQYISCYCLSLCFVVSTFPRFISIHLMLLFIYRHKQRTSKTLRFQYISCYCLSFILMGHTGIEPDFNTSHVTVYRVGLNTLSVNVNISIHLMLLFILTRTFVPSLKNNFNTSHVTVYLSQQFRRWTQWTNFNTSHVTVYPS